MSKRMDFAANELQNGTSGETLSEGDAYRNRENSGEVVLSLNDHLKPRGDFVPSTRRPMGMRCDVVAHDDMFANVFDRYRYMYTTLDERARALDRHLQRIQSDMCERAGTCTCTCTCATQRVHHRGLHDRPPFP